MFRHSAHIFACLVLIFSTPLLYASGLPGNPRDDTPAQSLKRMQNHFKNQDSYNLRTQRAAAEQIANVKMGAPGSAQRVSIEQLVNRTAVLDSGAKATLTTKVTQPVNNAKVASTLVDRLKKAKDYAKHVGKASVPSFVGMAVFHGLMEGVGWVMDEGGKVTKKNEESANTPKIWKWGGSAGSCNGNTPIVGDLTLAWKACFSSDTSIKALECDITADTALCYFNRTWVSDSDRQKFPASYAANPNYDPTAPQNVEVTNSELETALKNALESNNVAQAQLIAEAIKAAYSNDATEGQDKTSNSLVTLGLEDMSKVQDQVFDNPTSTATADKPSGYYKITDGEKTIEGYVTPADTSGKTSTGSESTTVTDPVTGNQTTTGSSSGSLELPAFCDWAAIMCEWYKWTVTDEVPAEEKLEKEEDPILMQDVKGLEWTSKCPEPEEVEFTIDGETEYFKILDISHACEYAPYVKAVVIFQASMQALYILAGIRTKGGDDE